MAGMVIIGAGEAGVRAAFALRERGYDGAVTLIGSEPSLPYERPPLSKNITSDPKAIRSADAYEAAEIDLRLGVQVKSLDTARRQALLSSGERIACDKLLLATGARARRFPAMADCLTLRTDRDASAIMQSVTNGATIGIVGGGFIGLELAATARSAGAAVTVFEAGPRLLGRAVPEDVARVVHARHEAEGVRIVTGIGVTAADLGTVSLADGTVHAFDAVIAGVGAIPNTELAEAAGLSVANGIVVDGAFRTSDPHIFAAGDCCNFDWRGTRVRLESWRAAQDQGAHAAATMLGSSDPYTRPPWFWSDQYDLTLQVAGLFDMAQPVHTRESDSETTIVFQCDTEGHLATAAGIGPGNAAARDIRVLEKLIESGARVDPAILSDPSQNLKRLLRAA